MAISVTCECGKSMTAKDAWAGQRVKCSGCGKPVLVPVPEALARLEVDSDDSDFPAPTSAASRGSVQAPASARRPVRAADPVPTDSQCLQAIAHRLGWILAILAVTFVINVIGALLWAGAALSERLR